MCNRSIIITVSRHDLTHQLVIGRIHSRFPEVPNYGACTLVGRLNALYIFMFWARPYRCEKLVLTLFARLISVVMSAGHPLSSPADLPTNVS